MKAADIDGNGNIEFSEFCTATMDKRKMLSVDRLKAAFSIFDKDGSGYISFEEIRAVL
jgi:calcium-dependent protein kinase